MKNTARMRWDYVRIMTLAPSKPSPKPEPSVIKVLREYRIALDAKERALMDDMARRWIEIERKLEADMSALSYEVIRRVEAGEHITEQMVWRMDRYKKIHAQVEDEIKKYNTEYAARTISQAQEEYAMLGIRSAQDAITYSYGAIGRSFNRLPVSAVRSMIGFAGNGAPLNKLLKRDYPDAVDGLMKALINGVARGQNPAQTAKDMADGMGMGLDRAVLIARTETARAYRTASTEQYRQSGVVRGFKRLVKKETACMACLMLDGEKFDLQSELYDHPRGKCIVVCDVEGVKPPTWQTGEQWFKTLTPEEQQIKMGAEKYQLWKDGQFKLKDMAKFAHSNEWGDSPRVATVKELKND